MTLADYIGSEQAREDVGRVIADLPARDVKVGGGRIWHKPAEQAGLRLDGLGEDALLSLKKAGAWMELHVAQGDLKLLGAMMLRCSAHYRPDGDRFVVTDLGEGVRTACLRGLDLANAEHFERLNALGRTLDADFRQTAPLGWIELRDITAADLPDAICRVMLASLKVSEVQP